MTRKVVGEFCCGSLEAAFKEHLFAYDNQEHRLILRSDGNLQVWFVVHNCPFCGSPIDKETIKINAAHYQLKTL